MKTVYSIAFFILLLVYFSSCKKIKTTPLLTEPTQVGANTFSCLISGNPLIARSSISQTSPSVLYQLHNGNAELQIYGGDYAKDPARNIGIFLRASEFKVGTYKLDSGQALVQANVQGGHGGYIILGGGESMATGYDTGAAHQGTVTFSRVDIPSGIFSGTFEMEVSDTNGKVIQISQGRFDLKSK